MPLAPYAVHESTSRGRRHPVPPALDRNAFQRDYTRLLHSQAFRRLQQKTQVFSANLSDLPRTRITHSLEVDQVARSIARSLGLNEDLCGVLAIGHDIGHAPFGHMGQDVLDELMAGHGGFEHNLQALRLVDEIESPYPGHRGLNLMFETREGLLKHCSAERARALGEVAARHLDGRSPSLEAQAVDFADAIAYVHADLEDAFAMGLVSAARLHQAPGFMEAWDRIAGQVPVDRLPGDADLAHPDPERARVARTVLLSVIREMMAHAITDLVQATRARLDEHAPKSPQEAREAPPLVGFSQEHFTQHMKLKAFSREHIYRHEKIVAVRRAEEKILRGLFAAFQADPGLLPGDVPPPGTPRFFRKLADHVSGMTDRFAVDLYDRLDKERPELIPEAYRGASQAAAADATCYPKPVSRRRPGP